MCVNKAFVCFRQIDDPLSVYASWFNVLLFNIGHVLEVKCKAGKKCGWFWFITRLKPIY